MYISSLSAGCQPCSTGCETCTGPGITPDTCSSCAAGPAGEACRLLQPASPTPSPTRTPPSASPTRPPPSSSPQPQPSVAAPPPVRSPAIPVPTSTSAPWHGHDDDDDGHDDDDGGPGGGLSPSPSARPDSALDGASSSSGDSTLREGAPFGLVLGVAGACFVVLGAMGAVVRCITGQPNVLSAASDLSRHRAPSPLSLAGVVHAWRVRAARRRQATRVASADASADLSSGSIADAAAGEGAGTRQPRDGHVRHPGAAAAASAAAAAPMAAAAATTTSATAAAAAAPRVPFHRLSPGSATRLEAARARRAASTPPRRPNRRQPPSPPANETSSATATAIAWPGEPAPAPAAPATPRRPAPASEGGGPTCVLCLCAPASVVLAPCGHVCICENQACAGGFARLEEAARRCPLCRVPVAHMIHGTGPKR